MDVCNKLLKQFEYTKGKRKAIAIGISHYYKHSNTSTQAPTPFADEWWSVLLD